MAVYYTQIEGKVFHLLHESIQGLGFDIVRIKNFQSSQEKTLQIMIERLDGAYISIEDCEQVSVHAAMLLDVEEIMIDKYRLEVSSPGLNRPLTRKKDFENNIGKIAKITLFDAINDRRRFTGEIIGVNGEEIMIAIKDLKEIINLNFNNIEEAFLQYFPSNINSNTK